MTFGGISSQPSSWAAQLLLAAWLIHHQRCLGPWPDALLFFSLQHVCSHRGPSISKQDLPVVLNNEGDNRSKVEKNEEQEVAITAFSPASDEKTTLESNKKK